MSADALGTEDAIAAALNASVRKDQGLSVPYARRWDVGGCAPLHSLRTYPYDGIRVLSAGVVQMGRTVRRIDNGIMVDGARQVWIAVNRSVRGEGPPDAYVLGFGGDTCVRYTVNAPEVVLVVLEGISSPAPSLPTDREVQVGFPGLPNRGATYVGSWQWDIHGEVRDAEFVGCAAAATSAVIRERRDRD